MDKHRKYLFFLVVPILILVSLLIADKQERNKVHEVYRTYDKDTLVYAISNKRSDYYIYRAEPVGYQLEMIRALSQMLRCKYRIEICPSLEERHKKLMAGQVDIMVCTHDEFDYYSDDNSLMAGFLLSDSSAWVVKAANTDMVALLAQWIAHFRHTRSYKTHPQKYFRTQLTIGTQSLYSSLSPYDDLIKQYADKINWDWRLLASLICQESRFNPNIESHKGAYGLMQIMPQTAESFEITAIEDPENNIEAGTKLIQYLEKYMNLDGMNEINRLKFILAAYNAGMGRINDCRAFAEIQEKDPDNWEEVAAVIPLMKHEIHYSGDAIQLGKFKGNETLNFVKEVWERYENYQNLVAP